MMSNYMLRSTLRQPVMTASSSRIMHAISGQVASQSDSAFHDSIDYPAMFLRQMQKEEIRNDVVYKLAFSSDRDAFKHFNTPSIPESMKQQLLNSTDQLVTQTSPLAEDAQLQNSEAHPSHLHHRWGSNDRRHAAQTMLLGFRNTRKVNVSSPLQSGTSWF